MSKKKSNMRRSPDGEASKSVSSTSPTDEASFDNEDEIEKLRSELDEAKAQIVLLQAELAQRDTELACLRTQLQESKPDVPPLMEQKLDDVKRMQSRLAQLKREQEEADAAKDTAWKQLRSVVGDIAKLAGPDFDPLASINASAGS